MASASGFYFVFLSGADVKEQQKIKEEVCRMADEQTVDQATQDLGDQTTETTTENSGEKQATFTQEQVNGIASKEAKHAQEKLLRDLGVEDFDSAKDGLVKYREYLDAQKSEAEKQAEEVEKANKTISEREQTIAEKDAEINTLNAKITALGKGVQSDSIEDVIALAERNVTEDVTMEQAIDGVLEKYPHFQGGAQPSSQATKPGNPSVNRNENVYDPFKAKVEKYK